MDVNVLELIRQQIYDVKVNAVIPWAAVQTDTWVSPTRRDMAIRVSTTAVTFDGTMTGRGSRYRSTGSYALRNGLLEVTAFGESVATFAAR